MSDYMPDELIKEILARLPVVSLLRFSSVCKSWYSLITSPIFVTKHLNQSIINRRRNWDKLLVRLYDKNKKERYLLFDDDDTFGYEYSELEFPFQLSFGYFRVVGSCNGLLCLCDDFFSDKPQLVIWNPSIRKSVTLPTPSNPQCMHMVVFGFGVHPTTQEYKVIRMWYGSYEMGQQYIVPPKVDIYTQGTRSWRSISSAAPQYCIINFMWSQAFLNGAVHWVAYECSETGLHRNVILSFDMVSESFSEIMPPPTTANVRSTSLSIILFGESLAVLSSGEWDGSVCCIWVMEEYGVAESWTKLISCTLPGLANRILGFRKNGEVLLASGNSLASYAPGTKTVRGTGITGSLRAFHVDDFLETLVPVEKRYDASEGQLTLL